MALTSIEKTKFRVPRKSVKPSPLAKQLHDEAGAGAFGVSHLLYGQKAITKVKASGDSWWIGKSPDGFTAEAARREYSGRVLVTQGVEHES